MIEQAIIFAAGFGKRMQPLTLQHPKPLLTINDKPLLYFALELALTYPFKRIIINAHYLASQIELAIAYFITHYRNYYKLPEILVITEPELLDTGGTLKSLKRYFTNAEAIFTINGDCIIKSQSTLLSQMNHSWDHKKMDFLMLIHPINQVIGSSSNDFTLRADGSLSRTGNRGYMYTGLQVVNTSLVQQITSDKFSLGIFNQDPNYDDCRHSVINTGSFCHASTPEDLEVIVNALK